MRRYRVRPGWVPSAASTVMGELFVILGIFVVIPSFGLFGVIWTIGAGVITATAAVNLFSAKGACSSEIIVDDGPEEADGLADSGRRDRFGESGTERSTSGRVPDVSDEAERLKKAEELYRQGLITYEEYQKKREEIIKSI